MKWPRNFIPTEKITDKPACEVLILKNQLLLEGFLISRLLLEINENTVEDFAKILHEGPHVGIYYECVVTGRLLCLLAFLQLS